MTYPNTSDDVFYTMVQSGSKRRALCGPHPTHGEATKHLDAARQWAIEKFPLDMDVTFGVFGVGRAGSGTAVKIAMEPCSGG